VSIQTRVGDLALCHNKRLGVIIEKSTEKSPVSKGIHLDQQFIGKPWQTKTPTVIGNVYDLLAFVGYAPNGGKAAGTAFTPPRGDDSNQMIPKA